MRNPFYFLNYGIFLSLIFSHSIAYGQCDANSPNVEITIESVEVLAGCDGDPTLDNSIEPTISVNGTVLVFSPSNSADGNVLGANPIPGTYVVNDGDLVNGCNSSTTVGIGAAGGSTMVPVNVDIWEEDGCGDCVYGTGSVCNDDADLANLGTVNVDITQPTGSFASGCYIFNYSVDCPPPCDPVNCTNDVSIVFTSVDAAGCDGDITSTVESSIQINGVVYEFSVEDSGNTTVSTTNENCAGTATIPFGTIPAGQTTIGLGGIEIWEEDGCGNCSYGTGSLCNDDADYQSGINHTIDLTQIGGTISGGCFDFNYEIICTSVCCLSAGATAGMPSCVGDDAVFNVSFNESDTPTTYEVYDQTNGVVLGSGTSSPISATATGPTTAGTMITIVVRDQGDPNGCVTPPIVITLPDCPDVASGCTDPCFMEYDPLATADDGSCATPVAPVSCDDGDACTINDMQVLGMDGSQCEPCAGIAIDCNTAGQTVEQVCDDGNPCTINDVETTLICDGSVCIPCAGTALDCNTPGATTTQPCDDGDPCSEGEMEVILNCDGSICQPCSGGVAPPRGADAGSLGGN